MWPFRGQVRRWVDAECEALAAARPLGRNGPPPAAWTRSAAPFHDGPRPVR